MSRSMGIDLGTTNSCVAVYNAAHGGVSVLANDLGHRITPSAVAFTDGAGRVVGHAAYTWLYWDFTNTVYQFKRLMGRRYSDPGVQADQAHWPFRVEAGAGGKAVVRVRENGEQQTLTPEEISAAVLRKLRETAEACVGAPVRSAVITVPAYFNSAQRQATWDAGRIAGLVMLGLVNEPTAAALAYGLNKREEDITVLVFDLGGGTLDVSLLAMSEGIFEVLAVAGDTHLGGCDFDSRLVGHVAAEYASRFDHDLRSNPLALLHARMLCESAKCALSQQQRTRITLGRTHGVAGELVLELTRERLEHLCDDLFARCMEPVQQVLRDAGLSKNEVDEVVLVGGATRMPKLRGMLRDLFGREPCTSINPDEVVAHGAALQAAILNGDVRDDSLAITLLDVTPLSLGVQVQGETMSAIVPRNTPIPIRKTSNYTTSEDNQSTVRFKVFEGERALTRDCNLLGEFVLRNIPPALRRVPSLQVTFEVDANGILRVQARAGASGNTSAIIISSDSGNRLSSEEVDLMVRNAEEHAAEQARNKLRIAALEALMERAYTLKRKLEGARAKELPAEERSRVAGAVDGAIAWARAHQTASERAFTDRKSQLEQEVAALEVKVEVAPSS